MKIKCVVTGKIILLNTNFWNHKIEEAGSEQEFKQTYVCKEVKKLLSRNYSIDEIKKMLGVEPGELPLIDSTLLDRIYVANKISFNENKTHNEMLSAIQEIDYGKSDPRVSQYIKNITST